MITVELEEEYNDWIKNRKRIPDNKIISLKVKYGEIDLGKKIRTFGGVWNKEKKVWELPYKYVKSLSLTERIVS